MVSLGSDQALNIPFNNTPQNGMVFTHGGRRSYMTGQLKSKLNTGDTEIESYAIFKCICNLGLKQYTSSLLVDHLYYFLLARVNTDTASRG